MILADDEEVIILLHSSVTEHSRGLERYRPRTRR